MEDYADIDSIPEGLTDIRCTGEDDCASWQECRDGFCFEPPDQFDSVSVAFTFELTSVIFTGNIVEPGDP